MRSAAALRRHIDRVSVGMLGSGAAGPTRRGADVAVPHPPHPPGREIYRSDLLSLWEVDGQDETVGDWAPLLLMRIIVEGVLRQF